MLNRFENLRRNVAITFAMLASMGWGGFHTFAAASPELKLAPLIYLLAAMLCLFVLLIVGQHSAKTGVLSAITLAGFSLIGVMCTPEAVSGLIPLADGHFIHTNREKWEVVALLSTAFMAIIYIDSLDEMSEALVSTRGVVNSVTLLLIGSIGLIVCGLIFLHDTLLHYLCVVGVTALFAGVDLIFWRSLRKGGDNAKHYAQDSKTLLVILDIPVLIGLLVLSGFLVKLNCAPSILTGIPETPTSYEMMYRNACVEAFPFMAGALAFQMISFNVIYVFFALRLHR